MIACSEGPAPSPAKRTLRRRYQAAAIACLLGYFLFLYGIPVTGTPHLVLAGVAGVFWFGLLVFAGLVVIGRFDEFQRILIARSFIWASILTMGIITLWGFVEMASHNTVPHFPIIFLPVLLLVITAAAKLFIFRQHRSLPE